MPGRSTQPPLSQRRRNHLQHALFVSEDLEIPEPNNAVTAPLNLAGPILIGPQPRFQSVLRPVEFHDEPLFLGEEVDDEGADGMLTSELHSEETPAAKRTPETLFRKCAFSRRSRARWTATG